MRRLTETVTLLAVVCAGAGLLAAPVMWVDTFDKAMEVSKKDSRPIMVFFTSPG
jgi:hypothetical protein